MLITHYNAVISRCICSLEAAVWTDDEWHYNKTAVTSDIHE